MNPLNAPIKRRVPPSSPLLRAPLTSLLGQRGRLALAALRHRDNRDVVIDAGLQAVDGVVAGGGLHHVLEDGNAVARRYHGDAIARYRGEVERAPAQADGGVGDVDEIQVR